jgi:hypothetical protein
MVQAFAGFRRARRLKQFADAQTQARRHAVPAIFGPGQGGDPDSKTFGDWLLTIARAGARNLNAAGLAQPRLDTVESSGVIGGHVVPPDFYQQLLAVAAGAATFRTRAFVQPMASATLQFPYLDITTVRSAGNSPFFGGVIASWTSEAQTRTETEPQFKMMELKAQELSGYTVSSNVLLKDAAFGLEKFLFTLFGMAVSGTRSSRSGKAMASASRSAGLTPRPRYQLQIPRRPHRQLRSRKRLGSSDGMPHHAVSPVEQLGGVAEIVWDDGYLIPETFSFCSRVPSRQTSSRRTAPGGRRGSCL